jgi:hypothetical protein
MQRIAFLLLAFFLAVIISGCGSPEQSVKMFLKYRIKGDTQAAKLYCTDEIDQAIDRGVYTLEALGFPNPYGTTLSWESEKAKMNLLKQSMMDKEAVLSKGSGPTKVTFHLKYEGGMWKISSIEPATTQPAQTAPPTAGAKPGEAAGASEKTEGEEKAEGTEKTGGEPAESPGTN